MERAPPAILFLLLIVNFGIAQNTTSKADEFHVGVILNLGSLVGKVARTSVSLALQDFYAIHPNYSTKLVLHIRDSMASDILAASAAIELLEDYKVQAIIGPQKSSEAVFISKLGNITQVPTISFTATSPSLTSATSENIMQELYKLMTMQTRVFIVHMSSTMTSLLFTKAQEVGMMNKGFVWIITNGVANILESLNPSVIEAMNGVIGDNPDESPFNKLSIVGLWGYDAAWALAQAAEKTGISSVRNKPWSSKNSTCFESMAISTNGTELLGAIVQNKFTGLSSDFDLTDRQQLKVSVFQIINVVGRGYREIGFWTFKSGLSRKLNIEGLKITGSASMLDLNPVIWPVESTEIPRGWEVPTSGNRLRVGVRTSAYPEFIKTFKDPATNATKVSGLSVDIFEEVVKRLPFALTYVYIEFDTTDTTTTGSYNDFVYQVYLQKIDIAVADITVRYNRTLYVDFTVPYTESGVGMIVPVKEDMIKSMWIFLKPLSTGIQLGITMFFSIFEEKEKLERFLSRIVILVWMFFLLVLTSSYTSSFASMLTVQQLSPTVIDVHELQKKGEYVGFRRGSYIEGLLVDIGFERSKIRPYDTHDEFYGALSNGSKNGGIAALVLEVPYIKLFLKKYNKGYTMVGPIYKSAGFAFVLPKQSPLRAEISRAILNITGGDSIIQIENKWINQNSNQNEDKLDGLGAITFESFGGLFLLTGIVTTCSLSVAMLMNRHKKCKQNARSKGDDQNECGHGQQGENGDSQGNRDDENGNCSDIENQTTLSVPLSSNTNGDQLPDNRCTQTIKAASLTHTGSQIIHRGDKSGMSLSGSS
ncbi:hypothetical protein ACQ4PT_017372 [Festuca glaucescens]